MNGFRGLFVAAVIVTGAAPGFLGGQPPMPASPPEKTLIEEGRKSKLGVYPRTVANGAQIMYVVPDSPAYKIGLEPGDVIVSVDGFTVGFIDGLEYPLQSEIRRVKGTGTFKIRSVRTGEIVTRDIKLGDDPGGTGPGSGPPKAPGDPGPKPASSNP